jgi:hypothetical protein
VRRRRRPSIAAAVGLLSLATGAVVVSVATPASAVEDHDWLGIVNTYRAMSGLAPVTANGTWSSQAEAHSCYMLYNGITHDEVPGNPGYTSGGDTAGNSGNVAVSSSVSATPRSHIDLWMTGPFHAIGILRHNLAQSGFGLCANSSTSPWRSGATLDVIRGIDGGRPRPATPIVFPGNGATVPLHSFITEFPNPMTMCGWSGTAGLPLIAMLPADVTAASATLTGPNGPIPTCTLHKGNVSDATARAILDGDNAVVVMPRQSLADGTYSATVSSNGGNATWSFTVDRDAPLSLAPPPMPDTQPSAAPTNFQPVAPFRLVDTRINRGTTRLRGGQVVRIDVGGSDIAAVSANFVAVSPTGYGFVTAFNCTAELPSVSTLGYEPWDVVANQAIVPLANGDLCVYSLVDTDLVIDVNGYYRTGSPGSGFAPVAPNRLFDSRSPGNARLVAGQEYAVQVAGVPGGAPTGSTAAALNVTAVWPQAGGFLKVYPCGAPTAAEISTINYDAIDVRPNSVVTPLDDAGRVCLWSLRDTDVVVDYTGNFGSGGRAFQALSPIRMFDSRSPHASLNEVTGGARVGGGQVVRLQIAGRRGVPPAATAVSMNLTATDPVSGSFLTAYPCGDRPSTSNLNIAPGQAVAANGAMVKLSSSGEVCVYADAAVHVIVDVNGVWL